MLIIACIVFLLAIIVVPQWWVKSTIEQHNHTRDDIPGTGGQFAEHLLRQLALDSSVTVEQAASNIGDHYHPEQKAVRLSQTHFNQRSLSAMVIAAHEVGHAVQDAENNPWMHYRSQMARWTQMIQILAPISLTLAPVLTLLTKSPLVGALSLGIGLLSIFSGTLVSFLSLPLEFDASFNKAMPILSEGGYLNAADLASANRILKAAALTYVAASLTNLLNIGYWLTRMRKF
ncbi:MAG: zinc metallopeptidase [Pseudomonadales bacterium]|nr:zinc metallopeptidase [Pseudomonadales bacterium]